MTRQEAEDDRVLDLCLESIDRCRPFFIGILGGYYGWVPERFPDDAIGRYGWVQYQSGKSITELEVLSGVLRDPAMQRRAFFYFRDPAATESVPELIGSAVYREVLDGPREKLVRLKRLIRESGYPVMDGYPARWDARAGRFSGLEAFGARVGTQLRGAIRAELCLPAAPAPVETVDPLSDERDLHERFSESRRRAHVGRDGLREQLVRDVCEGGGRLFLLTGPSGGPGRCTTVFTEVGAVSGDSARTDLRWGRPFGRSLPRLRDWQRCGGDVRENLPKTA